MLTAACAVAEGALPEREAHPRVFDGLLHLIAAPAARRRRCSPSSIRWEALLLADLGYGLDLSSCPVTGATEGLAYVSPNPAGRCRRKAPGNGRRACCRCRRSCSAPDAPGDPAQWRDGLRLTGHFLARDVFGLRHRPLPLARQALYDRVAEHGGDGVGCLTTLAGKIEDAKLADALSERYLAYALSTIMSRSLPDVRDGLKPVHRRLIYAMHQLRLDPTAGFKKCARVVGDVIGKYHPHGDASIYEALVRLAQDFAARYPLVEGQGNFGNIDGDNAAAMRYTEARLTEVAKALLAGIDDDAVDFRPTYDGEESEPVVLPGGFPNLLANGAAGIAVGMATSIPPHNAGEVCAAAIALRAQSRHHHRRACWRTCPAPISPPAASWSRTRPSILQRLRDRPRRLPRAREMGGRARPASAPGRIVVTEIPYQVQKAKLIEQIAQLHGGEETAAARRRARREHRDGPPGAGAEDPQRRAGSADGDAVPRHRAGKPFPAQHERARPPTARRACWACARCCAPGSTTATRCWSAARSHRLAAIERRLEILDGFIKVYLNLDEVIRIIRNEDEPKPVLMRDVHAVRRAGRGHPQHAAAQPAQAGGDGNPQGAQGAHARSARICRPCCGDEKLRWDAHRRRTGGDAQEIRRRPAGRPPHRARRGRRRSIDVAPEAFMEREPITVILSDKGWIRAVKGHVADPARAEIQGRRPAAPAGAVRDHRPAVPVRHQRPRLHAEGRRPAARPRRRPGRAPAGRDDQRGRRGRAVRAARGRALPGRLQRRPRLRGEGRGTRRRKSAPASRC